jgi:hypothetical protein
MGDSSIGRTLDSGLSSWGSNPCPPANGAEGQFAWTSQIKSPAFYTPGFLFGSERLLGEGAGKVGRLGYLCK